MLGLRMLMLMLGMWMLGMLGMGMLGDGIHRVRHWRQHWNNWSRNHVALGLRSLVVGEFLWHGHFGHQGASRNLLWKNIVVGRVHGLEGVRTR